MSDYASIEKEICKPKNYTNENKWTPFALEEMLLKTCNDIENWEGPLSYFEMPDYLIEFWNEHKQAFYEKGLKSERYAKYLELKKEFGP